MWVILDEDGYFTGNYLDQNVGVGIYMPTLPPDPLDIQKSQSYKIVDGVWVYDEEHYLSLCQGNPSLGGQTLEEKLDGLIVQQEELKVMVEDNQTAIYAIVEMMMEGEE